MNCIRVLLMVAAMLFGAVSVRAQAVSSQGTWETTLQARDVGNTGTTNAFYDTVLGITWLRNANVNGQMDWNTAMSWASNLAVGGVSGWRLPTMAANPHLADSFDGSTAQGFNSPGNSSEMASLFYDTLGNKATIDTSGNPLQAAYGLTNTGSFQNMQSWGYWTKTEYAPGDIRAWGLDTSIGYQNAYYCKCNPFFALAVHPGDVGAVVANVPEPETYAMLLAGLALIGVIGRRRSRT